jgi:hypothetical protein
MLTLSALICLRISLIRLSMLLSYVYEQHKNET